jgi:hypothetical protein
LTSKTITNYELQKNSWKHIPTPGSHSGGRAGANS